MLPSDAGPCDGVYVRGSLAPGTLLINMTGMEVSPDFDLAVPYYSRIPWAACQQLCLDTPGCRSVSYTTVEQVCRLKAATCPEAQLGVGCRFPVSNHAAELYIHADRYTTFDFLTSSWQRAVAFLGLSSREHSFDDSVATCQQLGLSLAPVHVRETLLVLNRAAARAVNLTQALDLSTGQASALADQAGPFLFWLGATYNAGKGSGAAGFTWLDGTRFLLDAANITIRSSTGCLALTIPNREHALAVLAGATAAAGTPLLSVQPCESLGVPLCAWFPEGVLSWTAQADSTVILSYDHIMMREDAASFCASKGGRLFKPSNARHWELLQDVPLFIVVQSWIDGFCDGPVCTWSDGSPIPADIPIANRPPANTTACITMVKLRSIAFAATPCSTVTSIICLVGPRETPVEGLPDLPARLRLYGGHAFGFFAAGRDYLQAEQQCALLGGHLASVTDQGTNNLILETWYDLDPPSNNFIQPTGFRRALTYLGGDTTSGAPTWLDGTPYAYQSVTEGAALTDASPACIVMTSLGPEGPATWETIKWQDCVGYARFNYTCKLPAKDYLQFSAAVTSQGALYELHDRTPRTYPDAREACLARGGDMASLDMGENFQEVITFLHRFRHETGQVKVMGDSFAYFVGAVTNKTGSNLYSGDFAWQDGSPYSWPAWLNSYPNNPVDLDYGAGIQTVGALSDALYCFDVLVRRRHNHSLPFLCKVGIRSDLNMTMDDGTTYEVLSAPGAVPYHEAEQVCQSRGGHLAGITSSQQLAAVSALCQRALQGLSRSANGGFVSHDTEDGCWVGLYCPGSYDTEVGFKGGFGERGLQLVAADQPGMLRTYASSCNSTADLLWLNGRSLPPAAEGVLAEVAAAAATLAASARCGLVRPNTTGAGNASIAMVSCRSFSAFICERGPAGFVAVPQPILTMQADSTPKSGPTSVAASADVTYRGCFALVNDAWDLSHLGTIIAGFSVPPTPLPILVSRTVSGTGECYNLSRQAGLPFFGIYDRRSCWGALEPPRLPFLPVADDSACYTSCSTGGTTSQPECAKSGRIAVFEINRRALIGAPASAAPLGDTAAPLASPSSSLPSSLSPLQDEGAATQVPYVCMTEEAIAAPNASIVGQLHISRSQLSRCEALCNRLQACDMYIYLTEPRVCALLSVPVAATAGLASLPVFDAIWSGVLCVKAERLVTGASLRQAPGAQTAAPPTHLCGKDLAGMLQGAGVEALSPRNSLPVANVDECAQSCAANATCQGFLVWTNAGGSDSSNSSTGGGSLRCSTRGGLVADRGIKWVPTSPWVMLSWFDTASAPASAAQQGTPVDGCLVLPRLAPPPAYVCTSMVDAAGWEVARMGAVNEQTCRRACDADPLCSLYVMYGSASPTASPLGTCSLRHRAFYTGTVGGKAVGSNHRPNSTFRGTVRSCLHTYRFFPAYSSPAAGRRTRQVLMGLDQSWHTCVPSMDVLGLNVQTWDNFDVAACAQSCSAAPTCTFFSTSNDYYPDGVCYQKNEPIVSSFYFTQEYPNYAGLSRIDLLTITDSCFNMDRQLPRAPPSYACARQYALAGAEISRQATDTAFACEALCDVNPDCISYTWMEHNGTCILGQDASASNRPGTAAQSGSASTGPAWFGTQTCLHLPRLMTGPGAGDRWRGQWTQLNSAWHYCVGDSGPAAVWTDSPGGADLLGAVQLTDVASGNSSFDALRACSRACSATDGCQVFTVGQGASPACLLRGWSSGAPLGTPVASPSSPDAGAAAFQTCAAISEEYSLPAVATGVVHPRLQPAVTQAYGNKLYSVFLAPVNVSVAMGFCHGLDGGNGGGGRLLAMNSEEELAVVEHVLRPFLHAELQALASEKLRQAAFWTDLVWGSASLDSNSTGTGTGGVGCSNWCYSHGGSTNTPFIAAHLPSDATAAPSTSPMCAALAAKSDGTSGPDSIVLQPVSCTSWSLPFVCEQELPVAATAPTGLLTRVFPDQAGHSDAARLAAAAGAVLNVLDLTPPRAASGAATALSGSRQARALSAEDASSQSSGATSFGSISDAAAACGPPQLRSSGCWLDLQAPPDACGSSNGTAALCGATAVLVVDSLSPAASRLRALTAVLGPAPSGDSRKCVMALVDAAAESSAVLASSVAYLPAPCATPGGYLATVTDPDAPLRAALADDGSSSGGDGGGGGSSTGTIVGAVVGSVVGTLVLVLAAVLLFALLSRKPQSKDPVNGATPPQSCWRLLATKLIPVAGAPAPAAPPQCAHPKEGQSKADIEVPSGASSSESAHPTAAAAEGGLTLSSQPSTPLRNVTVVLADGAVDARPGGADRAAAPTSAATYAIASGAASGAAAPTEFNHLRSDASHFVQSSKFASTNTSATSPWGLQCSSPLPILQFKQLAVTEEDPDRLDVTWQIDPKRDVTWNEADALGKGTFGIVYRGTYRGQPAAIKTLVRSGQGQYEMESLRSLLQEARILAKLRHPNIVTCHGGCITDTAVFIVEELMVQTLGQLIASAGSALLPLETILKIGIDVASGLFLLHPTIVHRDLKPDNVLLDATGTAKISDFGLARFKLSSYLASTKNLAAGTIPFMAPEALREELRNISEKADIYSLAIILWTMLTGNQQPWQDFHYAAVLYKVSMRGERPPLPEDPARCPPRLAGLINRMWAQEPSARPGAGEVLKALGVILLDVQKLNRATTSMLSSETWKLSGEFAIGTAEERGSPGEESLDERKGA